MHKRLQHTLQLERKGNNMSTVHAQSVGLMQSDVTLLNKNREEEDYVTDSARVCMNY